MHHASRLLPLLQQYAQEHPFPDAPAGLYEPCAYILTLGGKRLRPIALLMGYELFDDQIEAALPAAWAVELFHNFTLVHDDIMDAAPLRRSKPTVHTKWNATTGILSGDVMLIWAYRHLLAAGRSDAVRVRMLATFNRVATEVCEGQQMDVDFEQMAEVSIPEYLRMIELKTAVLLGGALEMGACCAGAPPEDVALLYQFGCQAGIAFQIQDDLLDTYGDPEKFGKQVGGDILQNKKTLLVLKTLEVAPPADRLALQQWMQTDASQGATKIEAVRVIFDRNGIPAIIKQEQQRFQEAAFAALGAVQVPEARKTALRNMVSELFVREQ